MALHIPAPDVTDHAGHDNRRGCSGSVGENVFPLRVLNP